MRTRISRSRTGFGGAGVGPRARSRPRHFRRQRHQDRLHIAAGLEAEEGAAVVEQVELDVAAALDELRLALLGRPGLEEMAAGKRGVDLKESFADRAGEGEVALGVASRVIVEEDA